jgi:translocation and assembly module TamA
MKKTLEIVRNISSPQFYTYIIILVSVFVITVLSDNYTYCAETDTFRINFNGISDENLLARIRGLSKTLDLSKRSINSVAVLRKLTRDDMDLFRRLLKSEGYIDAEINEKIETEKQPWVITFYFTLKTPFILSSVNVRLIPCEYGEISSPDISITGMGIKRPYRSKKVMEGEEKLLYNIRKQGFPFPVMEKREIIADHASRSVTVNFLINPGQKAVFGATVFKGVEEVDQVFLIKYIPWKEGDPYDPELLTACYKELMDLGLFSTIMITEAKELNGNRLNIDIEVNERKHNSLSIGLFYFTDEGPGIKFLWENRNLFRQSETLGFLFSYSNYLTTTEVNFKKPAFLTKKQTLRLSLQGSHDEPDAYTSDSYSISSFIDRELTKELDVSAGMALKSSKIDQLGVEEKFSLLSLPVTLGFNNSDDLLDPGRGGHLVIKLIPFYEPSEESLFYNKGVITYRHYLKIADKPGTVLAGSITVGMMSGSKRDEVPADERFYAGGGGSVRGYAYQSIGPLSGTTPLGGKSLFEMSVEARVKMTRKLGLVIFMDGGSAFSERPFSSGEKIRLGTGTGLRYYTPIGPLRFDIGFPLQKREGIDDSFQLYISIGQAF